MIPVNGYSAGATKATGKFRTMIHMGAGRFDIRMTGPNGDVASQDLRKADRADLHRVADIVSHFHGIVPRGLTASAPQKKGKGGRKCHRPYRPGQMVAA